MKRTHDSKNRDYAGDDYLSNFMMCERMGIPAYIGVMVRMSDKMTRLMNLVKSGNASVKSESISDTLTDLAVYSIIARILYENDTIKRELSNARKISAKR